jgi:hypothetical protein
VYLNKYAFAPVNILVDTFNNGVLAWKGEAINESRGQAFDKELIEKARKICSICANELIRRKIKISVQSDETIRVVQDEKLTDQQQPSSNPEKPQGT